MKKITEFFSNKKNLPLIITLGVILVFLVGGGIFVARQNANGVANPEDALPESEVIPTVDASVKVNITPKDGQKKVVLSIKGIPNGTEFMEYSLSYETSENSQEGAVGEHETKGKSTYEKEITLGTCSRNVCRYHSVVGPIRVEILFEGSYGKKLFEKEFEI